ncbi:MAG: gliding motility-associated C-terminal domain-containing protein, partial [Bacteroidota bacterium]
TTSTACENANATYSVPGCYDVTHSAINSFGCVQTITIPNAVCTFPNPFSNFTFGPQTPTTDEPEVILTEDVIEDGLQLEWLLDGEWIGADSLIEVNLLNYGGSTAPICLRVTDQNGCQDIECKNIEVIQNLEVYVPNAFSPNNDNINDTWKPMVLGIDQYDLKVFDRWSNIVFESTDPNEFWDGSENGGEYYTDINVYQWRLRLTGDDYDGQIISGTVTVLR